MRVNNETKLDVGSSGLSDLVTQKIQYIRTNVRRSKFAGSCRHLKLN